MAPAHQLGLPCHMNLLAPSAPDLDEPAASLPGTLLLRATFFSPLPLQRTWNFPYNLVKHLPSFASYPVAVTVTLSFFIANAILGFFFLFFLKVYFF